MNIKELAQKLGISVGSIRMRGYRNGTIYGQDIPDLIAADMLNKATKDCPQCMIRHSRPRFCSDTCRVVYGKKGRALRGRLHPMASEHIAGIKGEDRRIRLSEQDKEEMRYRHKNGESIHSLSKEYDVNKRSVQFVIYPERYEHAKMLARKRRAEGRYKPTKEQQRIMMAEHRAHKRAVLERKGKL